MWPGNPLFARKNPPLTEKLTPRREIHSSHKKLTFRTEKLTPCTEKSILCTEKLTPRTEKLTPHTEKPILRIEKPTPRTEKLTSRRETHFLLREYNPIIQSVDKRSKRWKQIRQVRDRLPIKRAKSSPKKNYYQTTILLDVSVVYNLRETRINTAMKPHLN